MFQLCHKHCAVFFIGLKHLITLPFEAGTELQILCGGKVLGFNFVVLKLQAAECQFDDFVFALGFLRRLVVKLFFRLLVLPVLLPSHDLLVLFFQKDLVSLALMTRPDDGKLQLDDLLVFYHSILV